MSRSNKPRIGRWMRRRYGGGYGYRYKSWLKPARVTGNRRGRRQVRTRLKDINAERSYEEYNEKSLKSNKHEVWDRWYFD